MSFPTECSHFVRSAGMEYVTHQSSWWLWSWYSEESSIVACNCMATHSRGCHATAQAGVERFVFISAAGSQHVHPFLAGYWRGKKKAEAAIEER